MSKNHQLALDLIKVNIVPRVRRCIDGNVFLEVDGRHLGQPYGVLRYSQVLVEVKPREFDELYDANFDLRSSNDDRTWLIDDDVDDDVIATCCSCCFLDVMADCRQSSPVQLVSSIDHYASGVIVAGSKREDMAVSHIMIKCSALQSNPLLCDALIDRTYESHVFAFP